MSAALDISPRQDQEESHGEQNSTRLDVKLVDLFDELLASGSHTKVHKAKPTRARNAI